MSRTRVPFTHAANASFSAGTIGRRLLSSWFFHGLQAIFERRLIHVSCSTVPLGLFVTVALKLSGAVADFASFCTVAAPPLSFAPTFWVPVLVTLAGEP